MNEYVNKLHKLLREHGITKAPDHNDGTLIDLHTGKTKLPPGKSNHNHATRKETLDDELASARITIQGELRMLQDKHPKATRSHMELVIRRASKFDDPIIGAAIEAIRSILR